MRFHGSYRRDSMRVEMEIGSSMLVSGIEKISRTRILEQTVCQSLVSTLGLPAVAYGVIKRINEIVEEILRQVESSIKGRNEARELVEQRNYKIAIEVLNLRQLLVGLREEVAKKSEKIDRSEKVPT